jgi:hypothetical protein
MIDFSATFPMAAFASFAFWISSFPRIGSTAIRSLSSPIPHDGSNLLLS